MNARQRRRRRRWIARARDLLRRMEGVSRKAHRWHVGLPRAWGNAYALLSTEVARGRVRPPVRRVQSG